MQAAFINNPNLREEILQPTINNLEQRRSYQFSWNRVWPLFIMLNWISQHGKVQSGTFTIHDKNTAFPHVHPTSTLVIHNLLLTALVDRNKEELFAMLILCQYLDLKKRCNGFVS